MTARITTLAHVPIDNIYIYIFFVVNSVRTHLSKKKKNSVRTRIYDLTCP